MDQLGWMTCISTILRLGAGARFMQPVEIMHMIAYYLPLSGQIPSIRSCPSWCKERDSVFVFGGYDGPRTALNKPVATSLIIYFCRCSTYERPFWVQSRNAYALVTAPISLRCFVQNMCMAAGGDNLYAVAPSSSAHATKRWASNIICDVNRYLAHDTSMHVLSIVGAW